MSLATPPAIPLAIPRRAVVAPGPGAGCGRPGAPAVPGGPTATGPERKPRTALAPDLGNYIGITGMSCYKLPMSRLFCCSSMVLIAHCSLIAVFVDFQVFGLAQRCTCISSEKHYRSNTTTKTLREPRGGPENLGRRRVPSTRLFRLSMVVCEDRRTATGDLPPRNYPRAF